MLHVRFRCSLRDACIIREINHPSNAVLDVSGLKTATGLKAEQCDWEVCGKKDSNGRVTIMKVNWTHSDECVYGIVASKSKRKRQLPSSVLSKMKPIASVVHLPIQKSSKPASTVLPFFLNNSITVYIFVL